MLNKLVRIAAPLLVAVAALMLVAPQRGKASEIDNVLVVNGPKRPVPVSGNLGVNGAVNANVTNTPNVNVAGLPAVQLAGGTNVGISGTPNVNVANTPTVNLAPGASVGITGTPTVQLSANGTLPVQEKDNTVQQPFQAQDGGMGWPNGQDTANGTIQFPAGKRFIIEYVSSLAAVPAGQKVVLSLETEVNGTFEVHRIPLTFEGAFSRDFFQAGESVRLYADAAANTAGSISAQAIRNSTSLVGNIGVTLSGHLVDLP